MDQLLGVFKTVLDATTGNNNCLIRFSFSGADDDDSALFRSSISHKPWMDNPIWIEAEDTRPPRILPAAWPIPFRQKGESLR